MPERGFQNIYPYNYLDTFGREVVEREFPSLVLENEFLRATVVPRFGCRLFSLFDKLTQRTGIDTTVDITLRPGERLLHTRCEFRNPLPVRNGFMYWANPAVAQTPGMTFQLTFRARPCYGA